MTDPNTVPVTSTDPKTRVTSSDAPWARSARSPLRGRTRDSPVSSVSSVKGVGANAPVPAATRTVQPAEGRARTDIRGVARTPVLRMRIRAGADG